MSAPKRHADIAYCQKAKYEEHILSRTRHQLNTTRANIKGTHGIIIPFWYAFMPFAAPTIANSRMP